ncbi:transposase, partial [Massilia kyonggiensis]|nr:transposase [Massilia kyonggiensis]
GVSALATLSTGEQWPGPKALRSLLDRLRRMSRSLSRKVKGYSNRERAKRRLARLHVRIANLRRDGLHKLTTSVTRRFHTIGIEDLNVRGMLGNHRLARAIADVGFYELRRQLSYKTVWRGGHVVVVDRWYPSSKTCSCCKYRLEELALGTRSWTCPACGVHHDRDVNAAVNLKNMAMSSIATACGGNGAGPVREHGAKPVPAKQEPSGKS